jgi:hypothetical protein
MCMYNRRPPPWALPLMAQVAQIQKEIQKIMALVQVEQADLDTLSTDLAAAVSSVSTEITNLEAAVAAAGTPLPAGSLDALKAGVASLQALEVPVPPPATG